MNREEERTRARLDKSGSLPAGKCNCTKCVIDRIEAFRSDYNVTPKCQHDGYWMIDQYEIGTCSKCGATVDFKNRPPLLPDELVELIRPFMSSCTPTGTRCENESNRLAAAIREKYHVVHKTPHTDCVEDEIARLERKLEKQKHISEITENQLNATERELSQIKIREKVAKHNDKIYTRNFAERMETIWKLQRELAEANQKLQDITRVVKSD